MFYNLLMPSSQSGCDTVSIKRVASQREAQWTGSPNAEDGKGSADPNLDMQDILIF